jgi:alkylated DNA repair dioxygenase AlkB
MESLFPLDPIYPQGFSYYPDFLSLSEEQNLLTEISKVELHAFHFQGYEAKRRVASFGYDYSFDKRSISKGREIPSAFHALIEKTAVHTRIRPESFQELLITEYPVGSVINWHRDAPPFDVIVGVSLLSDCNFRLRPHDKTKQSRSSIISLPVRRRSLYVIDGVARTEWQHSTTPVKSVRYSITLRTLKTDASTL